MKELIELKNRARSMSRNLYQCLHLSDHVPQIHPREYFCLAHAHFFIFFLTSLQCFRFGFL